MTANTNNDQAKEAELIQTYIAQGVSGITIAPLSQDASIPNLKEATANDIQVAITNMNLAGDPSWLAGGYTSDDATNGRIVGTNAAEFIKANITGAVNVAQADSDHQIPEQSKARYGGFYAGLDEAGLEYSRVAAVSANMQDDAVAKVADMLTAHPEINVIWAATMAARSVLRWQRGSYLRSNSLPYLVNQYGCLCKSLFSEVNSTMQSIPIEYDK